MSLAQWKIVMVNQAAAVIKYSLLPFFILCVSVMGFCRVATNGSILFIFAYTIAFLTMLSFWKLSKNNFKFYIVFITAVVSRLLMLYYPAGDDINRYIWEGEIQNAGYNPFELAPDSKELIPLRNENWKGINHKHIPTIYWPAAQIIFKFIALISPTVLAFKFTMMLFDIGIILLLFFLIKSVNAEPRNIILYALNPFTMHWISGEGHLESVMVFWMLLSFLFYNKRKWGLMYISLSLSILTKITPLFIIPFLIKKENLKYSPFILFSVLLFIPYLNKSISPFWVPILFTEDFTYNGLINNILREFFSKPVSLYISIVIAGISYIIIYLTNSNYLRSSFLALGVFIICTPTFHPWYLLVITPFIVIYNSPAWIALHLTVVVKSFFWINSIEGKFWHNDDLLLLIEYIPFFLLALYSFRNKLTKFPFKYDVVDSVSVIIPTLNEEKNIESCLEAIKKQSNIKQVIISDCGSIDKTITRAKSVYGVEVINSEKGRGTQIENALSAVKGDVIVIVHADSILKENAFNRMINILNKNRDVSGGAFGAHYADHKFPLLLPRFLNVFRAAFLGISFGDQSQFFRRVAIKNFPKYKLMEDIELSMRMKECGKTVYIPHGVISSSRMWRKTGYLKNFIKVIYLSTLFLIKRRFGFLTEDCGEFYKAYYGK